LSEDFPAQLASFRPGSLLAGYRLEAQVGTGGMAVVFRARDQRLHRLVALKILAPVLAADGTFRRRFIAESRAAAAVDDPHIIPVHEAGEADGVLFIAMRFVQGGDLRRVLEQEGALRSDRVAGFISPIASALDAAHAVGLVHRDVKPANILVDARPGRPDHVYLSDFGVSKGATASVSLTGTGQFLGTPDYSAPEQIQGRAVDGRTDQYALACVAYQLLTGSVPFGRDQGMAVLLAHLSEPPPSLGSRRPDLPAAADEVLARALAKTPEKRYGSCGDFADALREALGLTPYHPRAPATAPDHPRTEIASPLSKFPGPGDPITHTAAGQHPSIGGDDAEHGPSGPPTADASGPSTPIKIHRRPSSSLAATVVVVLLAVIGFSAYHLVSSRGSKSGHAIAGVATTRASVPRAQPTPTAKASRTPSATASDLVIKVAAVQECWVELTKSSDGSQIYLGSVLAGTSMTWAENQAVSILLGNPGGVTLTVNGKVQTPNTAQPVKLSFSPQRSG
jgi:serine/threonine-protein kinase